jgi:hypothetical protein
VAGTEEFRWQFDFDTDDDDDQCCGQRVDVDIAQCASHQLSSYTKQHVSLALSLDDDAVYPPWAVCDERFGAVA